MSKEGDTHNDTECGNYNLNFVLNYNEEGRGVQNKRFGNRLMITG